MKIFLSWSGGMSHEVAKALNDWLPYVIQGVEPFLSSDMNKGEPWSDALADELNEAKYGILCLTPYNLDKPWMNFEAGALSKTVGRPHVVPFLFRVHTSVLRGPLTQFQCAVYDREDVLRLVQGINKALPSALDNERLERTFDKWWTDLDDVLKKIPAISQGETRTHYEWLYTREDLDLYNPAAPYDSFWVVACEIGTYLDVETVKHVEKACEKGRTVRYFVSDSQIDYKPELDRLSKRHKTFEYGIFKAEDFETQVASDYIVCNPDGPASLNVQVKLPQEDSDHREYWFKTDDRSARSFVNRFKRLWDSQNKAAAAA